MLYIFTINHKCYQSLAQYTLGLCQNIYNLFKTVQLHFFLNILYTVLTGLLSVYVYIPKKKGFELLPCAFSCSIEKKFGALA